MTNKVHVGLLGLGTVGGGVFKTIRSNRERIRLRTGADVEITRILVRDMEKERHLDVAAELLTLNREDLLGDERITVFIEVMGGLEPARTIITEALRSGRHVITANKELMAKHGAQLLEEAAANGVHLLFEGSVAGGIPIIHLLQGYLTANRVYAISGILNGTCNYILTEMAKTGREYAAILQDAQELGYAEADPASDVEGHDAAYKLAILTNLAYDARVNVEGIERQGITELRAADIALAEGFGYRVKLVGTSREQDGTAQLSVRPRLLPLSHPLAGIDDVFNAVTIEADVVGELTFIGRGAGEFPTASAVLEDLTKLLQGESAIRRPAWRSCPDESRSAAVCGNFYLAFDGPGEDAVVQELNLLEAALAKAGAAVADRRLLEDGSVWRHAWLIGGVTEQELRAVLAPCLQTADLAAKYLLLPVDGPLAAGVEWKAETSHHEVSVTYPRAL